METGSIERRAVAAARAVARAGDVPCEGAMVISAASNVLVHLRPSPLVARVMTGTVALHDDPERWLRREVSVLTFLAPTGLAVPPSPLIAPGPYRSGGLWMTIWERVDHRGRAEARDAARLGRALRELHEALAPYGGELDGLADVHRDNERLRRRLRPSAELSAARIESLGERLMGLSDTLAASSLPTQALHGDASLSNLLRTPRGLLWNDFEDVFRGPVEWDLAGYAMSLDADGADSAFVQRVLGAYGGVDPRELATFSAAHALYLEIWQLYDAQRRSRPAPPG